MKRFIYAKALQSKGNIASNKFYYIDVNHIISLDTKYETKGGPYTEIPTCIRTALVSDGCYNIDFVISESDYQQLMSLITEGK